MPLKRPQLRPPFKPHAAAVVIVPIAVAATVVVGTNLYIKCVKEAPYGFLRKARTKPT